MFWQNLKKCCPQEVRAKSEQPYGASEELGNATLLYNKSDINLKQEDNNCGRILLSAEDNGARRTYIMGTWQPRNIQSQLL